MTHTPRAGDDDLRAALRLAAPEPPSQLLEQVLRATDGMTQRTPWWRARWLSAAGAIAATAIVAAVVMIAFGQRDRGVPASPSPLPSLPAATPEPTARPTPERTSEPTPTPVAIVPPSVFADWERIDMPDPAPGVYGGGTPVDVVAFGGGYVAVGSINAACCADGDPTTDSGVVWLSNDGRSWELADPQASMEHSWITGLFVDGERLFAFGAVASHTDEEFVYAFRPAIWTSDDGRAWTAVDGAPTLVDDTPRSYMVVGHGPGGFVAAITEGALGDEHIGFWSSADGVSWQHEGGPLPGRAASIAIRDDGKAVAVGTREPEPYPDGSHRSSATVWVRSPDGSWSSGTALTDGRLDSATTWRGGFAVTGNVETRRTDGTFASGSSVWTSTDGSTWEEHPLPVGESESVDLVFGVDGALVVIGSQIEDGMADAMILVSTDAVSWGRVADSPAFSDFNNGIYGLVETSDGLLGVGHRWNSELGHPVPQVWIASR